MSQRRDGSEPNVPGSDNKSGRHLTLLEKVLTVLGAAFALATAVLGFLTVQSNQATSQARSSATSAGADLSSLQAQYSQLKSQNAQLQSELSAAEQTSATTAPSAATLLGSYTVNINFPSSIPLAATKPTQSEFSTSGLGDLGTAAPADHLVFVPINGNKMVSLPGGGTPTYETCADSSVFVNQADSKPETSFCIVETGKIAGVTVTSLQPSYAVLNVTVWKNG
jgi:hypothetical protein